MTYHKCSPSDILHGKRLDIVAMWALSYIPRLEPDLTAREGFIKYSKNLQDKLGQPIFIEFNKRDYEINGWDEQVAEDFLKSFIPPEITDLNEMVTLITKLKTMDMPQFGTEFYKVMARFESSKTLDIITIKIILQLKVVKEKLLFKPDRIMRTLNISYYKNIYRMSQKLINDITLNKLNK